MRRPQGQNRPHGGARARLLVAAPVAVITALGGAGVASLAAGGARPPAPHVVDAWAVGGNGDGLHRFVVSLASYTQSRSDTGPNSAISQTSAGAFPGAPADTTQHLDLAALANAKKSLGDNGSLSVDSHGRTMYVVGSRELPVGLGSTGPAASVIAPTPIDDGAAGLAQVPGIASAQRLRDGSVLVATSLDAAAVAKLPGVRSVTRSTEVRVASAVAVPNDPYFNYDWHLRNTGWAYQQTATAGDDVDALDAWSVTQGGGAVVAVLDTGFDTSHADLAGALWTNPNEACGSTDVDNDGYPGDCHGWNFYRNNTDLDNAGDDAHGTLVSGSIAARMNNGVGLSGLAPQVKIMPLVVGAGESVDMSDAIQAIYFAVDHGADVINCSFGGTMSGAGLTALQNAVAYAQAHGVMLAVAAGNDSGNRDVSPMYPASVNNPALVAVGASDANDQPASFSGYGKNSVALFAPGTLIATTDNTGGYSVASGTSLASPLVAATLALEKSADPTATVAQLRSRLLNSTTPLASLTSLSQSGGRLNAGAAVGAGPGVLHYRFGGFAGAQADQPLPVRLTVTGSAPAGPYTLQLRVVTRYNNDNWAVSQLPVSLGSTTTTTDDDGLASLPIDGSQFSAGQTYQPTITVPAGQYALVAQVVAGTTAVGRPTAAVFTVGSPAGQQAPASAQPSAQPTPQPTAQPTPQPTAQPGGAGSQPSQSSQPAPTARSGLGGSGSSSPTGPTSPSGTAPSSGSTPSGANSPQAPSGSAPSGSAPSSGGSASGGSSSPRATSSPSSAPNAAPSAPSGGGSSSSPSAPSSGQYPGTDQFQITGLSPTTVATSGGLVTVSGRALPAKIAILVGGVPANVLPGNTANSATFLAPSMLAGHYDVAVYQQFGAVPTTLVSALTYQAGAPANAAPSASPSPNNTGGTGGGGGSPSNPASGNGAAPTQPPTTATPTSPNQPAPSQPAQAQPTPGTQPTAGPTPAPSASAPAPQDSAAPNSPPASDPGSGASGSSVVTTPDGLRLVHSSAVSALADLSWDSSSCDAGDCDGVPL